MTQTGLNTNAVATWRSGEVVRYPDGLGRGELLRLIASVEVVDVVVTVPGGAVLFPIMGGQLKHEDVVRLYNNWLKTDPISPAGRADEFTLNDATAYWGTHDPAITWNGFACPFFAHATVKTILRDLEDSGQIQFWSYCASLDFFHVMENDSTDGLIIRGVDRLDLNGLVHRLYPLGAMHWCWSVAS